MSLNYSFVGKRVLVTGGGRGIGLAISKLFYNDGADLYIIDKDQGLLEEVKKKLPKATLICQDLLQWDETRKVVERLGALDHLVNNAGILICGRLEDLTEQAVDKLFGVNFKAVLNCSIGFVNAIKVAQVSNPSVTQTERTIVNISSFTDRIYLEDTSIYCATKAAVTSLTNSMANEFSRYKIRANCVCPGFTETDLALQMSPGLSSNKDRIYQDRVLVANRTEAIDIAQSVVFLSSPLSSKITAASLVIDMGASSN